MKRRQAGRSRRASGDAGGRMAIPAGAWRSPRVRGEARLAGYRSSDGAGDP